LGPWLLARRDITTSVPRPLKHPIGFVVSSLMTSSQASKFPRAGHSNCGVSRNTREISCLACRMRPRSSLVPGWEASKCSRALLVTGCIGHSSADGGVVCKVQVGVLIGYRHRASSVQVGNSEVYRLMCPSGNTTVTHCHLACSVRMLNLQLKTILVRSMRVRHRFLSLS
jgi:hypothetical protein